MNQLATVKANATESALMSWDDKVKMASTLIKSGFLPPAYKTPEQVIAVMMKGQELGIPTMEALTSINVIQQKPTLSPQLMLALVRRTGQLQDLQIEKLPDSVKVTVTRKGQSPVASSFGREEADALGLSSKDNYKKQRFVMYQWRALAANLRLTFSDCIAGMYTPEEMGAEVKVADDGGQLLVESHVDNMDEPGNNSTAFNPTYEELEAQFTEAVNKGNVEAITQWGIDNAKAIEKLGPETTELFRKAFREAVSRIKKVKVAQ